MWQDVSIDTHLISDNFHAAKYYLGRLGMDTVSIIGFGSLEELPALGVLINKGLSVLVITEALGICWKKLV